jgi:hypothetical protein
VGVVLAHDLAHHAGALVEGALGAVAAVEHGVQHPAVHGFEAVADVREGTAHDDGHRVVQVGPLHFRLQVHLLHAVYQHVAFKNGVRVPETSGAGFSGVSSLIFYFRFRYMSALEYEGKCL